MKILRWPGSADGGAASAPRRRTEVTRRRSWLDQLRQTITPDDRDRVIALCRLTGPRDRTHGEAESSLGIWSPAQPTRGAEVQPGRQLATDDRIADVVVVDATVLKVVLGIDRRRWWRREDRETRISSACSDEEARQQSGQQRDREKRPPARPPSRRRTIPWSPHGRTSRNGIPTANDDNRIRQQRVCSASPDSEKPPNPQVPGRRFMG